MCNYLWVKEMERLIAAANCARYFETVKKPNKFQKFNSEFLSSYIESQLLSCLGRYSFGFLLFVFIVSFFLFFISFGVFLVLFFFFLSRTDKISETGDVKHLSH